MTFSTTNPRIVQAIFEGTVEQVMLRAQGVVEGLLGEDDETYGQIAATGADFLNAYRDLLEREIQVVVYVNTETGESMVEPPVEDPELWLPIPTMQTVHVMDNLRVINPRYAEKLDREYEREIQKLSA